MKKTNSMNNNTEVPTLLVNSANSDEILRFNSNTGEFIDVFISGNSLDFPSTNVIGPDGNLYVSSGLSNEILRYDSNTGEFIDVFVSGNDENGLDFPAAFLFGPDENLYVSSVSGNQILRFDGETGEFIDVFASGDENNNLNGPSAIKFGPDGNLYVSNGAFLDPNFTGTEVLRFDGETGEFIDVFASGNGLSGPAGLSFGPDGNLYVSSIDTDEVLRFDGETGEFIDVFASGNSIDGPTFVTFGPDNNLYVSSNLTNEVFRFDGKTGEFIDVIASENGLESTTGLLFTTTSIAESADTKPTLTIDDIFDESYYLEVNQDAADAVAQGEFASGLEHFQAVGLDRGLRFSPFIDLDFYRPVANPDLSDLTNRQALDHLLEVGLEEGRRFSPVIELDVYKELNPEIANLSNSEALIHLRDVGLEQGLQFSSFANLEEYRSFNPELSTQSLTDAFSHLATFFAPEDEGRIRFPLDLNAKVPDELEIVTPEMVEGSADVTITYSKSANTVVVELDVEGLPYRETFTRPEDVSTPFNQQLVSVEDARWQVWMNESFSSFSTFWYDGQTGDLLGNEFELFGEARGAETPIDVNNDGVLDAPLSLPVAQTFGSPIVEGNPDGTAKIRLEYAYDQMLDERGTAGTLASPGVPYNINRPEEVGLYYTDGGLPVSEAVSWDDILDGIRERNSLNIGFTAEPEVKPEFLDSRPNPMQGFQGFYPILTPRGVVFDGGTGSYRLAEPEDFTVEVTEPFPVRQAEIERETESVFGSLEIDDFDAANPSDNFDGNRDTIFTGAGDDFVDASQATGAIFPGTAGENRLFGGTGVDELLAGRQDRVSGGVGEDILDASTGSGNNRLFGGEGNDELFAGIEDRLFAGVGDDILDASTGNGDNRLFGGDGNDTFFLGSGDRLVGGNGNDAFFVTDGGNNLITGGEGTDAFWIAGGEFITKTNTITDFEVDEDVIGIAGIGATSVDDLEFNQIDNDTVISFSNLDLATLLDTTVADLQNSSSFVFNSPDRTQDISSTLEETKTSEVQAVQDLFDAIATADKESFLELQTSDVDWRVDGNLLPVSATEIQEFDLIPFAGDWSGTESESEESAGDFFDELQESLSIANFEPLDILQDDDLILARANFEATVNETELPFDLDVSFIIELEDSESGQSQIESVEMVYQAIRVAEAFADVSPSPEAVALDARDPLTGVSLSVDPNASSEESQLVVEDAYFNNFLVGDVQGFGQSFTDNGVIVNASDPAFFPPGGVYEGTEEIETFLSRVGNTLETQAFEIPAIIADADRVGLIGDIQSTARATGISADFRVVHWLTVDDDSLSNFEITSNTYFTASAIAGEPLFVS